MSELSIFSSYYIGRVNFFLIQTQYVLNKNNTQIGKFYVGIHYNVILSSTYFIKYLLIRLGIIFTNNYLNLLYFYATRIFFSNNSYNYMLFADMPVRLRDSQGLDKLSQQCRPVDFRRFRGQSTYLYQ